MMTLSFPDFGNCSTNVEADEETDVKADEETDVEAGVVDLPPQAADANANAKAIAHNELI